MKLTEAQWRSLYRKYSHVGCPAEHYEDNCAHPGKCADNGCCIDLQDKRKDAGRAALAGE